MAPEFWAVRTFLIGFFVGVALFVSLYTLQKSIYFESQYTYFSPDEKFDKIVTEPNFPEYKKWFENARLKSNILSDDELRYVKIPSDVIESNMLFKELPIICVVYTTNVKNARAINDTWSKSCNEVMFYSNHVESDKITLPIIKSIATSSFHLLCDIIRKIMMEHSTIKWAIFVKDDMFVIPENLRYLVAPLNSSEGHYLGHPINFWGVDYNIALAGFVLSQGAMRNFVEKFPNTEKCIAGGKYFKQEDLYLGKHLRGMGIYPVDTRDKYGHTLFLGYDLDKMMFPGSMNRFANYYTRALYPVKCCGPTIITFPILSSTEVYKYHYMIYTMRVFIGGSHGNRPAPTAIPETQVWQSFLQERGLPLNSSAAEYERLWYVKFDNVTVFPGTGNAALEYYRISKMKPSVGGPDKLFNPTNMPEVLVDMLTSYSGKKNTAKTKYVLR